MKNIFSFLPLFLPLVSTGQNYFDGCSYLNPQKITEANYQIIDRLKPGVDAQTTCMFTIPKYSINHKTGRFFDFKVAVCFNSKRSWLDKQSWFTSNYKQRKQILEHEIHHYISCIYYAKKLYVLLNGSIIIKSKAEMENVGQKIFSEYDIENNQYDNETTHGLIDSIQVQWTKKIDNKYHSMKAIRLLGEE